ncbi:MAG: DNA polymerase I [Bdellovibrionales bacterium]|nr:DNA polymerase I [Bdellovibrionales bacterium]
MKKKIYLVDVSSMFFRAYYAIRPLTTPAGVPVNAVYGFLSMVTKLFKEEKPDYMVFTYDRKEPSFRKNLYAEYKANRTAMPDDLAVQIPYIKKLADYLGIPALEVPDYEADDIIGTLVHLGLKHHNEVVIVSGDKDFGQLIQKHVVLFDTMKDVKYDEAGVLEKWGVPPEKFIDYLAIMGDTSDNVPGVDGIGPKGAQKLLQQFESVEDIYENIDKVEPKGIREKLIKSKDNAFLSKKLVTIATDVPLSDNFEDYHLKQIQADNLRALLQELNFKSFEKTLLGDNGGSGNLHDSIHGNKPSAAATGEPVEVKEPVAHPKKNQEVEVPGEIKISTLNSEVMEKVEKYLHLKETAISADALLEKLHSKDSLWGFADERGLFIGRDLELWAVEGSYETLGPGTDAKQIQWSGFDLKTFFHQIKAEHPKVAWDSSLAAYVVRAGDSTDFGDIYKKFIGAALPEFATPAQLYKAHVELQHVLQDRLGLFGGEKIVKELELPLVPVLLRMENKGIRIDVEALQIQSAELTEEIAALEKEIHHLAGESFNVGSPKQLGVILFEKMSLPSGKKTKTGYSTGEEVLEKIEHPIAKKILQWRELSKLKSTYVDALPEIMMPDGRVHTSFNQALTTTGRLSSTQPNLQNIPIRTERGQRVRQAFIADKGKKLLSMDYSQIELRILAHISDDPGLQKAFREDLDIHAATAAEIFNVDLKNVTSDQRRSAKAVNFGIAYGQGAFGLAENLGIPNKEAKEIIERYFAKFAGVREYINNTVKLAHENGYVETLFGRRRYIEELNSKNPMLKKFGERAAINAPIQGTASDLVKKAMIDIGANVPVDMLLQVHDELIFEGTESVLQENVSALVTIMENVMQLKVPLKVNYAIGNNWDEAH